MQCFCSISAGRGYTDKFSPVGFLDLVVEWGFCVSSSSLIVRANRVTVGVPVRSPPCFFKYPVTGSARQIDRDVLISATWQPELCKKKNCVAVVCLAPWNWIGGCCWLTARLMPSRWRRACWWSSRWLWTAPLLKAAAPYFLRDTGGPMSGWSRRAWPEP